jgi:hypothetical protein
MHEVTGSKKNLRRGPPVFLNIDVLLSIFENPEVGLVRMFPPNYPAGGPRHADLLGL